MNRKQDNNRRPTSSDVARLAGVGRVTVSRVINDPEAVSEETRRKVQKAMTALSYRPSAWARGLVRGRYGVIGFVSDVKKDSYHRMGIIDGIQSELNDSEYWFGVASVNSGISANELENISMIKQHTCDGFIFNTESLKGDLPDFCRRLSLPSIFVNVEQPPNQNSLIADDEATATQAVDYLISKGHSRIGYLTSTESGHEKSTTERMKGYEVAMLRAGLQPIDYFDKLLPSENDSIRNEIDKRVNYWLAGSNPVTAILTYGPSVTMHLFHISYDNSWTIPDRFSVMSCDDTVTFDCLPLPITSMSLDRKEMGSVAAEMLIEKIENNNKPIENVIIKSQFKERMSVASIK